MLKKITLICVLVFSVLVAGASEPEFKMINALNYHKSMFAASQADVYLKIPFGKELANVGGCNEDPDVTSEGVPWAFRMVDGGKVWVLDSLNGLLKLFTPDGKVERSVSLTDFGQVVKDFAVAPDGSFAFLNAVTGYVYQAGADGKRISEIEGFNSANSIEFSPDGDLLIDHPIMQAILRFGSNGEIKEQYVCDETLSLYGDASGTLIGLKIDERLAELYLRTVASPATQVVLASFPYTEEHEGVRYVGGKILGKDAAGNIYLNLVACDNNGNIYRDRLYRCSNEGKNLGELDVLTVPFLAPDLPRKRVVCPDGRIMGYYTDDKNYVLCVYSIPKVVAADSKQ
ncbi:MAG: hypothetical protein EOM80_00905 [Erysipelotrichia bacterium]|nr:hypothetical protein [Erysipelotrichia bacterium]